jgi:hypothetical protein
MKTTQKLIMGGLAAILALAPVKSSSQMQGSSYWASEKNRSSSASYEPANPRFKDRPEHYTGHVQDNSDNAPTNSLAGNLSAEEVPYNSRFSADDVKELKHKNIYAEIANEYSARFNEFDISCFVGQGVSSKEANEFDKRFSRSFILGFHKDGIKAATVNAYSDKFTAVDIDRLLGKQVWDGIIQEVTSPVAPEIANAYANLASPEEIRRLNLLKVDPKVITSLDRTRFSGFETLSRIAHSGITNVNEYSTNLNIGDVLKLIDFKVTPEQANPFATLLNRYVPVTANAIITYVREGITPDEVRPVIDKIIKEKKEQLIRDQLK